MNSQTNKENIQQELRQLLRFRDEQEKIEFEAEMIHLHVMNHIQNLMDEHHMNKAMLAKKLQTSKGYISQLFSGDKFINLKLLAKLQKIFHVKFEIAPQRVIEQAHSDDIVMGFKKSSPFKHERVGPMGRKETHRKQQEYKIHHIFHEQQKVA